MFVCKCKYYIYLYIYIYKYIYRYIYIYKHIFAVYIYCIWLVESYKKNLAVYTGSLYEIMKSNMASQDCIQQYP